jgi:hypothetical protein
MVQRRTVVAIRDPQRGRSCTRASSRCACVLRGNHIGQTNLSGPGEGLSFSQPPQFGCLGPEPREFPAPARAHVSARHADLRPRRCNFVSRCRPNRSFALGSHRSTSHLLTSRQPQHDPASPAVRARLPSNMREALARHVTIGNVAPSASPGERCGADGYAFEGADDKMG